jgi:hypothetical protein
MAMQKQIKCLVEVEFMRILIKPEPKFGISWQFKFSGYGRSRLFFKKLQAIEFSNKFQCNLTVNLVKSEQFICQSFIH